MKKGILLVLISIYSLVSFSQTEVVEFLKVGREDANKFTKAYLQPYAFALGEGLNNGWYSTAETHHLWGFDLTIGVSAIQVPEGAQTFDLKTLGLSNRVRINSGNSIAPTVAGADAPGPLISVVDQQGNEIVKFNSPQGTGLDIVPVPMAQVGFGLIPHTDLIGRFVPEMKYDNNGDEMKIGLWGLGLKHNFKEWIPVLKSLPFDASLFASYSEINGQSELSFTPADYNPDPNVSVSFQNLDDQSLQLKTKTSKFGLIVSKKFSILTVFGAIGQSTSKSNIDVLGTYPVIATASSGGFEITQEGALKDPIALEFETSNLSLEAGLRVKLAVVSLFGSINKSEYTAYNVGLSLGLR